MRTACSLFHGALISYLLVGTMSCAHDQDSDGTIHHSTDDHGAQAIQAQDGDTITAGEESEIHEPLSITTFEEPVYTINNGDWILLHGSSLKAAVQIIKQLGDDDTAKQAESLSYHVYLPNGDGIFDWQTTHKEITGAQSISFDGCNLPWTSDGTGAGYVYPHWQDDVIPKNMQIAVVQSDHPTATDLALFDHNP